MSPPSRSSHALINAAVVARAIGLGVMAATLAGCGHDSSSTGTVSTTTAVTNYTVGGSISGLTAGSVVLANGTATVTVAAGVGSWVFPTSFAPGTSYAVTVQTQPATESCAVVSGGSGSDTGNVANVAVVCGFGQWTWEGGANMVGAAGVYGTQGTAAPGNLPGGRFWSSSWTDASGNFWMFGGVGYDSAGASGYLNDLWQYSPTTGQWTWVSGLNAINAVGVYGTQGTAAAGNAPGARQAASTWSDASGNLWLYGGIGYGASGGVGELSDLWKFSPSTGQWTWISGGSAIGATGSYGTLGTAASGNAPGARHAANAWSDASGNLWLFGGIGYGAAGGEGELSDLWKFSPSSAQWTWVSGGSAINAAGVYGTQGTAASTNAPGARYSASAWTDASGNLWLFGGYGYDSAGTVGKLSDLWKYSTSGAQWTWVTGEDAANAGGIYGTLGTAAAGNTPGARQAATSWIDASGNLWLFGGSGYNSAGGIGDLNDLWQYSPTTGYWTWVSGSIVINAAGVYGTQGTSAPGQQPGGRNSTSSWIDTSGNLWLFCGYGYDSAGTLGYFNDLWKYSPSAGS